MADARRDANKRLYHRFPVKGPQPVAPAVTRVAEERRPPPPSHSAPRACNNCKHAHLACDHSRPCKRCVGLNKADSCGDLERKKRGRPRLIRPLDVNGEAVGSAASGPVLIAPAMPGSMQSSSSPPGSPDTTTSVRPSPATAADDVLSRASPVESSVYSDLLSLSSSVSAYSIPAAPAVAALSTNNMVAFAPSMRYGGSPAPLGAESASAPGPAAEPVAPSAWLSCNAYGQIVNMSPNVHELLGERFQHADIASLVHERDRSNFEAMWRAAAAGSPHKGAVHFRTSQGKVALFDVEVSYVAGEGVNIRFAKFTHQGLNHYPTCIEHALPTILSPTAVQSPRLSWKMSAPTTWI